MLAKRLKQFFPFILLFLLLSMLWQELFSATSRQISGSMVGETLPEFSLPTLSNPDKRFTSDQLRGHVSLVNVWASWCSACKAEHAMLMKIKNKYHIPIYGILYKDRAETALQGLIRKGNPYEEIGNDYNGDTAIDFGIYGTPETFVVDAKGVIIYRQTGVIDEDTWDNVIYPIVKKYAAKS